MTGKCPLEVSEDQGRRVVESLTSQTPTSWGVLQ